MKRLASALLIAVLASGCAHAPATTAAAPAVSSAAAASTLKLFEPLPGLYTAGQPSAQDWAGMRARGITTVINLRTPEELKGRDEAAEVKAAGMRYLEIPVAGADGINDANAKLLHEALAPAHAAVLVHCASSNRAGALLALEQADFDGVSKDAALELARKAGVTSLENKTKQALGISP